MKTRLFNKYQMHSEAGRALAKEVAEVLQPLVEKYAQQYHLREIESVVMSAAGTMIAEQLVRNAIAMHDEETLVEIEEAAK